MTENMRPLRADRKTETPILRPFRPVSIAAALALLPSLAAAQGSPAAAPGPVTTLDTIVVTATGFEQQVKDAPASITVVTREELERGSFRDLTDALREVQGVAVTGGGNEKDITIRGLPGTYTLILVDGKRQSTRDARTNGSGGFEQSFVPPLGAIDRIEVVRGPMSSLYGSDAMGGVINIITRKVAKQWSGSVTAEATVQGDSDYGNSGQLSFYGSGPIIQDKLGLQVWGRGYQREEDSYAGDRNTRGMTEAKEGDISGRLTFTPTKDHDFALGGGVTRLRREASVGKTVPAGENGTYDYHDRKNWLFSHVGRWGWTTSDVSITQEWAERSSYTASSPGGRFVKSPRSPEIRNTVVDGKLTTPFSLLGDHTLVTGGQFFDARLNDQNPGRRTGRDETFQIKQWALFVEDEWRLFDSFALTGGLRMDHHEIYGSHVSPRLYGVWTPTPQLTIKGGVSTGFKAPEIRSIAPGYAYTTGGANCTYGPNGTCGVIIGDPGLKPETSTSYEFGAIWDSFSGLTLGATYFYTDFKEKIANALITDKNGTPLRWSEDRNYRLWYSYNVDNATIQGIELTANWQATDKLSFRGSYTYTDSEQKSGTYKGFPLDRTPEHIASLQANWVTPVQGLTTWAGMNYHGEETAAGPRIGTNGKPVSINGQTGRKYDAYTTFDLGVGYTVTENLTLRGSLYNVFDKRLEGSDYNTTMDGRRLWVALTASF